MNYRKPLVILGGALIIVAIMVPVWQQARINRLQAEVQRLTARAQTAERVEAELATIRAQAPDRAEFDRLAAAEPTLKLEVARLRNELDTARRVAAESRNAAQATPDSPTKPKTVMSTAMNAAMKFAVEQQTVGKLQRLKPRLNLTPQQEEAIRAILTRQAEHATSVAEKMFSGKLSREEMTAQSQAIGDPEAEIKALLTPEQLTSYAEFKQEENVSNARLVANAELLQMQGALGLNSDQQDKVYNALYDFTVDALNGKVGEPPPGTSDPTTALNWQLERKLKALEPVLTPEQLAAYRKLQDSQRKMIEGFLPPAAGTPKP